MIGIIFEYINEKVEVRIKGNGCFFRTSQFMRFVPIDALKLDKKGAIKEHPDLKDDDDWRKKTIERFKEKLKKMNNEKKIADYIINDLSKYGYKPLYYQESGHRPKKLF